MHDVRLFTLAALGLVSSCAISAPTDSAESLSPLLRIASLDRRTSASSPRAARVGGGVLRRGASIGRIDRTPSNPEAAARVSAALGAASDPVPTQATNDLIELARWCRASGLYRADAAVSAGDVVFFHNTSDANGDGRDNDWFSDAGIAAEPTALGTTTVALGDRSIVMTLRHAGAERTESGEPLNSRLRDAGGHWGRGLAGQLYAGRCRAR